MTTQKQNSRQYFRSVSIIYFALLFGQVAFVTLTLYLNPGMNSEPDDSLRDVFIYIVPIFVVNGFVAGQIIFKSRLKKIKTYNNLSSKMVAYRGAMIIRLAMLEGASLFTITICFLTADLTFLAISVFIIIYFIILKPTVEKIAVDLELNRSEKTRIGNPNEVIAVFETNQ